MLNTGLNNKEWVYLGSVTGGGNLLPISSQAGIKNIKIVVWPNGNGNWIFEFEKTWRYLADDVLIDCYESKYVFHNNTWQLIRLTLKVSKDGVMLEHCDINGLDVTSNTTARVLYNR